MADPAAAEAVAAEVIRLHAFFERWFAEAGPPDFREFDAAMGPDFYAVGPDGTVRPRRDVVAMVRDAAGSGVVSISIERPVVHFDDGSVVIATYEEHQIRGGDATARASTVVMRRDTDAPGGWTWLAVHETWLAPRPSGIGGDTD